MLDFIQINTKDDVYAFGVMVMVLAAIAFISYFKWGIPGIAVYSVLLVLGLYLYAKGHINKFLVWLGLKQ